MDNLRVKRNERLRASRRGAFWLAGLCITVFECSQLMSLAGSTEWMDLGALIARVGEGSSEAGGFKGLGMSVGDGALERARVAGRV